MASRIHTVDFKGSKDAEDPEPRDPEDRPTHNVEELREKMLDKTIADSFPTSDPPSSLPNPSEDDSLAA
ncbi:MAG TPA: hypothetical protein VM056_02255 [Terriglobales bacterium]|nr:hypothetical protein [Terriglobales bacterium]